VSSGLSSCRAPSRRKRQERGRDEKERKEKGREEREGPGKGAKGRGPEGGRREKGRGEKREKGEKGERRERKRKAGRDRGARRRHKSEFMDIMILLLSSHTRGRTMYIIIIIMVSGEVPKSLEGAWGVPQLESYSAM